MKEKKITKTISCSEEEIKELKSFMQEIGWDFAEVQHAYFQSKQGEMTVTAYKSGKIVLSGSETDVANIVDTIEAFGNGEVTKNWQDHIGVDESGKGDFFGSLVVVGVFVPKDRVAELKKLGVRDSKTILDTVIKRMKNEIVDMIDHEAIVISPEKYNELYDKMKNINKLLAWGHARVIENLLERHPDCHMAVSDQFSKSKLRIQQALLEKGRQIELIQMHKGEADLAVAAASVIARAKFVESIEKMSKEYGLIFPKGASDQVISTGKEFCTKIGAEKLNLVGKLHFSTSSKILP